MTTSLLIGLAAIVSLFLLFKVIGFMFRLLLVAVLIAAAWWFFAPMLGLPPIPL